MIDISNRHLHHVAHNEALLLLSDFPSAALRNAFPMNPKVRREHISVCHAGFCKSRQQGVDLAPILSHRHACRRAVGGDAKLGNSQVGTSSDGTLSPNSYMPSLQNVIIG